LPTFNAKIVISNNAWAGQEANLRAKEYDDDGAQVGGEISSGFTEDGSTGNFVFKKSFTIAVGEEHTVKFYLDGLESDSMPRSVVSQNSDGHRLASDGLDSISTDAPAGVASTFREMMVQTWRRWFRKSDLDADANVIRTYADDGSTVVTTQSVSDDGTTQVQGAAS
jgi:hypothetical protein